MEVQGITSENSYLLKYIEEIEKGNIIIGKELKTQLEILREDTNNPLFKFDLTEAHKRITFVQVECRHSISPFAGKPFILSLWQKAIMEALYGFYMEIDGEWYRRFTEMLLIVGRKNGKSSYCSSLALAEFFCGNIGTNIMCASNDYDQASILFDEVNNMREESRKLDKVSRKNIKGIFMGNPKQKTHKGKFTSQNKAKIKKLSVRTGGKEGRNLDVAIADETHEMKDESLIMPLKQSMSTKDEPLLIEITTEGFINDGHLSNALKTARSILKGEIDNPRKLIWLYTQDNEAEIWSKRETWTKSNPNLGISKKWRYLDDLIEEAKTNSATRAFMLAKEFNIRQSNAQSFMQMTDLINESTFDLEEFRSSYYCSGNDFSETTDLCSTTLLFKKPNDPVTYLYTHYWIPESKLEKSPDDVDYRQWEKDGHLTIIPGNTIDTSIVADYHFQLLDEYDIRPFKSGFDNRFAKSFTNRYEEIFGEKITINIPQDYKVLNNPMRTFEADMRDNLINYNNSQMDLWCYCNTGIKVDSLGRIMPCKMHETKRIDGIASAIDAICTFQWFMSDFMVLID